MSKYRLTEKGWAAYNRANAVYEAEIQKLRDEFHDPDYMEGWSIIDDYEHIHNVDEEIDLLIFGYMEYVIDVLAEWVKSDGLDTWYVFGCTYKQIISMISERGLLEVEK